METPAQAITPRLSRRLNHARAATLPGSDHVPWIDAELDDRPPAPSSSAVWDGERWIDVLGPLERARPCPGVAPRARARRGGGEPVSWRALDEQLDGVHKRRGRAGHAWPWDPSRSACETMANVEAQTARAADVGRADVREPAWLRDERWGLSPVELRFVAALVCVYEAGWGGLYDCQSTIAADLRLGAERTVRNLLWGQTWTTRAGEERRRPGLVERGLVAVVETWRPGAREGGRPSDQHWNLYRVGPAIELAAAINCAAKPWTNRAPRGSGWGRRAARRALGALRRGSARERYNVAGREWRRRPGRGDRVDELVELELVDEQLEQLERAAAAAVAVAVVDDHPEKSITPAPIRIVEPPAGPLVELGEVASEWAAFKSKLEAQTGGVTPAQRAAALAELDEHRAELLAVWPAELDEPAGREGPVELDELGAPAMGENGPAGPCVEIPGARRACPPSQPEPPKSGAPRTDGPCNWAAGSADDPACRGPFQGPRLNGSGWEGGQAPRAPGISTHGPAGPFSPMAGAPSSSSSTGPSRPAGGPGRPGSVGGVPPGTRSPPRPNPGREGTRRTIPAPRGGDAPPEARRWLEQLDDDDPLAAALLELLATRRGPGDA